MNQSINQALNPKLIGEWSCHMMLEKFLAAKRNMWMLADSSP